MGLSKTEFARRLRMPASSQSSDEQSAVMADSQRRGRSRARVLYWGEDVFSSLWSGDTRTMIQLIGDLVDQASEGSRAASGPNKIKLPTHLAQRHVNHRADRTQRMVGGYSPLRRYVAEHPALLVIRSAHPHPLIITNSQLIYMSRLRNASFSASC